jgi:hypothetical protein
VWTVTLEFFRECNAVLAVVVIALLAYRMPQALQNVSSKRLYLALCAFPLLVGVGSGLNAYLNLRPGPITPVVTAAYLFLGYVLVRWSKTFTVKPQEQP